MSAWNSIILENVVGDPLQSITVDWFLYELSARSRSDNQVSFSVSYNALFFIASLFLSTPVANQRCGEKVAQKCGIG